MGVSREETRKARKPHRCDCCDQMIQPGEEYLYAAGHDTDGDFGEWHFHPDCRAWEVKLCRMNDLHADEWMTLAEHVDGGGIGVLDGAPEAVRARFPEAVTPI